MKKKLTVAIGMVVIICVILGLNLTTDADEKQGMVTIPQLKKLHQMEKERIPASTSDFTSVVVNFCEDSLDDGTTAWYIGNIDSGWTFAVYMDPARCLAQTTYPFKITDVHFYLFQGDATGWSWPVDIQVNVRGVNQGNKCLGPDTLSSLCSQSFTIPIDSSFDSLNRPMNISLNPTFCINQPFFLEIKYLHHPISGKNLPSVLMDNTVTSADTCNNWGSTGGAYYEWFDFWTGSPPGDLIIRATGYTGVTECDSFWYWKPSFEDYAPSGMPDFDQKQDNWKKLESGNWTFCGPVAVANCFWWFDSKYNVPPGFPGDGIDQFPLVRDYLDALPPSIPPFWDDHDPWNVDHAVTAWSPPAIPPPPPTTPQPFIPGAQPQPSGMPPWGELVERLAWYLDTDGSQTGYCQFSGTNVMQMQYGIDMWLQSETLSVGVTLADSLYERTIKKPSFAEVESLLEMCEDVILLVGFWWSEDGIHWYRNGGHYVTVAGVCSDSLKIAFSDPFFDNAESGGPGRVKNGLLIPHAPIPGHAPTVHNDAGNVSHDIYGPANLESPSPGGVWALHDYPPITDSASFVNFMQIFYNQNVPLEFTSMTAPYQWPFPNATEVEYAVVISPTPPDTCWYWKPDTTRDSINAPSGMPDFDQYQFGPPDSDAFCGPTAVANCLWWFGAVPGQYKNDPAGFMRLLAGYFHTDKDSGTYVDSIQSGLDRYFADHGYMLQETTYVKPDFYEMEESLKVCQDIILLLGFWQLDGDTVRVGGHYVTMAGVCSGSGWVALSDPARNTAEAGKPGRVRPPGHPAHPIGNTLHNDPQYVSHDMYQALLGSPSPGGSWGLPSYDSIYQFEGQNFQPGQWQHYGAYNPLKRTYTEVEYAIMICPKPLGVKDRGEIITPKDFQLYQNHPNPFNSETVIKYELKKTCFVTFSIYNVLGERVTTLVKEKQNAGSHTVSWDGKDENGKDLASGVYFYELKAGDVTQTKRMVLLK